MNYELLKKLKEAGFPWKKDRVINCGDGTITEQYRPDLSDLIDACGDEITCLSRSDFHKPDHHKKDGIGEKTSSGWIALSKNENSMGSGSTPEEAVANLWLALNKK